MQAPRVTDIRFTDEMLVVKLANGQEITSAIRQYPRLVSATPDQRNRWKLLCDGSIITWEESGETIVVEELF